MLISGILYNQREVVVSGNYLDTAYRRFLRGQYTKKGFETYRLYIDHGGNSFLATACFYCGDMAQSEDHVFPLVALITLFDVGEKPLKDKLLVVPACKDCNVVLGSHVFPTIDQRKEYIKQRLRKRFSRVLSMPTWREEELQALGHTLRSAVLKGVALQRKTKERLAW